MDPLDTLRGAGLDVRLDGDRLVAAGPGPVRDRCREFVARHRVRLIAALANSICSVCGEPCHPLFNPHPRCDPAAACTHPETTAGNAPLRKEAAVGVRAPTRESGDSEDAGSATTEDDMTPSTVTKRTRGGVA